MLAARTGTVLTLIKTPGTYAYTVTVISAAGIPAVVVPGSALTGYALATGQRLWQYAAPAGASFSDAAYADGTVAAEYANSSGHGGSSVMAAVGISAVDRPARLVPGRRHRHDPARQPVERRLRRPRHRRGGQRRGGLRLDRHRRPGPDRRARHQHRRPRLLRRLAGPRLVHPVHRLAGRGPGRGVAVRFGADHAGRRRGQLHAERAIGRHRDRQDGRQRPAGRQRGHLRLRSDVFTNANATDLAYDLTYDTGNLVSGDFAGNGTKQGSRCRPTDGVPDRQRGERGVAAAVPGDPAARPGGAYPVRRNVGRRRRRPPTARPPPRQPGGDLPEGWRDRGHPVERRVRRQRPGADREAGIRAADPRAGQVRHRPAGGQAR